MVNTATLQKSALIIPDDGALAARSSEAFMKRNIDRRAQDTFGQRLAALRQARGFSQGEFAGHLGISQRTLCYYERETQYPPAHLLPNIAELLGCSVDELLGHKTKTPKDPPRNPRLQRKLRLVATLPTQDQKAIIRMIDAFLSKKTLEKMS